MLTFSLWVPVVDLLYFELEANEKWSTCSVDGLLVAWADKISSGFNIFDNLGIRKSNLNLLFSEHILHLMLESHISNYSYGDTPFYEIVNF